MRQYDSKMLLVIVTTIMVIVVLVLYVGYENLITSITSIDPFWLLIYVLTYTVAYLLRGIRWGIILNGMDRKIGKSMLIRVVYAGFFVNTIVPARIGDFTRAFLIREERKVPFGEGFASILVERLLDLVTLLLFAVLGFFMFFNEISSISDLSMGATYILIAAITIIASVFILFTYSYFCSGHVLKILQKISQELHDRFYHLLRTLKQGVRKISTNQLEFLKLFYYLLLFGLLKQQ